MPRILVAGKTGQLGWELQSALLPLGRVLVLDRAQMDFASADSIREVIAFPKTASGGDPLTGAPTPITPAQRKEAAIDFVPEPDGK